MRIAHVPIIFIDTFSTAYGLTEMVPLTMSDPILKKKNSVGTIIPNTTIKVGFE